MDNGNRLYICGTNAHNPKDYVIYVSFMSHPFLPNVLFAGCKDHQKKRWPAIICVLAETFNENIAFSRSPRPALDQVINHKIMKTLERENWLQFLFVTTSSSASCCCCNYKRLK